MRLPNLLRSVLKANRHHRHGVAAAEFALIAPIMVAFLLSIYDLGNAVEEQLQLQQALRAGGLYALAFPTQTGGAGNDGIREAIEQALPANLLPPATNLAVTSTSATGSASAYYVNLTAKTPYSPFILRQITELSANYAVRVQ